MSGWTRKQDPTICCRQEIHFKHENIRGGKWKIRNTTYQAKVSSFENHKRLICYFLGFPYFLNSKHSRVPGPSSQTLYLMCTLSPWVSSASNMPLHTIHMLKMPKLYHVLRKAPGPYPMSHSGISCQTGICWGVRGTSGIFNPFILQDLNT